MVNLKLQVGSPPFNQRSLVVMTACVIAFTTLYVSLMTTDIVAHSRPCPLTMSEYWLESIANVHRQPTIVLLGVIPNHENIYADIA